MGGGMDGQQSYHRMKGQDLMLAIEIDFFEAVNGC
jgi:DnaJ-class molecular chaperone